MHERTVIRYRNDAKFSFQHFGENQSSTSALRIRSTRCTYVEMMKALSGKHHINVLSLRSGARAGKNNALSIHKIGEVWR
jgi:hypothetical protein